MKHKLQKINEASQELCGEISSEFRMSGNNLKQIENEYHRVTELSGQAAKIIDKIDTDFKNKTKLSNVDIAILFLATAIQCARQYILTNDKLRLTAKQGDALIQNTIGEFIPPTLDKILFQSVPYDAITTGPHISETGLSGTTHRYRTLGHDPVLGWIFGTANIMTSSLTKYNLETYQVHDMRIIRHYPLGISGMFQHVYIYTKKDPTLLAAAVARQAIHFGSDYFTKQGLPVPLISTVNNDLAKNMIIHGNIDMWSTFRGAAFAVLINQLISTIHQLFYQKDCDGSVSLYEVRTRKILSYSNLMASGSNVIVSALTQDARKLDIGGMLVTLTRIASDYKFIHEIKKDFLKNELYNCIVGDEYNFMKEGIEHE